MTSQWYCVYCRPRMEATATKHLQEQNFECYYPRVRNARDVTAAMFPRYVFAKIDIDTQRWKSVNGTIGVSKLVCNGDKPCPLDAGVINALKKREGIDGFIRMPLSVGDRVRVGTFDGLFDGNEGDRIAVMLSFLGRDVRVVVDANLVAAI